MLVAFVKRSSNIQSTQKTLVAARLQPGLFQVQALTCHLWFQLYLCPWLWILVYCVKLFRMEPGNNWTDILHQDGSEFGDINIWPQATDPTSVFPFFWAQLPFSQTTNCVDWESLAKYLQKPQKPGWRVRGGGEESLFVTFLHLFWAWIRSQPSCVRLSNLGNAASGWDLDLSLPQYNGICVTCILNFISVWQNSLNISVHPLQFPRPRLQTDKETKTCFITLLMSHRPL